MPIVRHISLLSGQDCFHVGRCIYEMRLRILSLFERPERGVEDMQSQTLAKVVDRQMFLLKLDASRETCAKLITGCLLCLAWRLPLNPRAPVL